MHKPNDPSLSPSATASAAAGTRNGTLSDRVRSLRLADRTAQGGKRGSVIPWALAAVFLLAAVTFAYRAYRMTPDETTSPEDEKLKQLLASAGSNPASAEDLEKIKKILSSGGGGGASRDVASSGEVVLESKGYITPIHQIQISPQVGGEIIWLDPNFKEGARYKKGDRLAEVDPVIFVAQLKNAQAALQVAETNLKQVETGSTLKDVQAARSQLKNMAARLELSRIDDRNKRRAGIGSSRDELEKAAAQVDVDKAAYDAQMDTVEKLEQLLEEQRVISRSQVLAAQAATEQAAKQLKNCTITAPTTGIVLSKKAELGGYVNPLAFGAAGYLCEMADLSQIEVDMSIQERDFAKVIVPLDGEYQICSVMPEAFQRDDRFLKLHPNGYDGYVSRVMPVADRAKGAITVRVRVRVTSDEAGIYLKPDMGVVVSFKSKTTKDVEKD